MMLFKCFFSPSPALHKDIQEYSYYSLKRSVYVHVQNAYEKLPCWFRHRAEYFLASNAVDFPKGGIGQCHYPW